MLGYVLPIVIIVVSNVFYNIVTKSTPSDANPFASLFLTYLSAALVAGILMFFQSPHKSLSSMFHGVNWTGAVLGLTIVGLEFGYITAYRAGWNISVGSLVANILLAVILVPVGLLLYKESITLNQCIGILLCIAGLVFINKR